MRFREFQTQGAGCLLVAQDTGRWCLQQRSDSVSDPGVWSTWGGGREPGESLEQTVRRELAEEAGYHGPLTLYPLSENRQYVTFVGVVPQEFEPRSCSEWKDYCWVDQGQWPQPLHHKLMPALEKLITSQVVEVVAEGEGFDQEAGIGIDGKSFKFKIRDLVAFAEKYPVTKIDPNQFADQLAGREEDPAQSMARVEKADLQYPIIVVKRKNGQLWIADGTHRAHKAILNKLPAIQAKIIPIKDMTPFAVKQGVAEGTNNITYKQQKGKNKFSIEMFVDGKSAGIFQYDAESGRTIVELDPAFRGQGLGQRLILKGIYTAAMLGMDYVEDESRTQMFDRAMDRLVDAGYIVNDNEYWYVTSNGEQFLKQGVAEDSENYNGIQLSLEVEKDDEYVDDEDTDNQTIYVKATANGRELGHVLFTIDYDSQGMILNPQDLEVDDRYRGQGIAATMYDYVKSKGYRIRRSGQQTDAGAGFWNKHKPGKNIWEQGVAEGKQPGKAVTDAILKVMPVAQEIWFHGSRATGKHRRNSDTDILVVVPDDLVGDQYLATVRTLQKLSSIFDNYDLQPTKSGTNIHRIAQEEGQLLWSNKQDMAENFADGRNPGRRGLARRVGVNCKQSVTKLRSIAKKSSGERQRMAHWCANMKSGKNK